MLIIALVLAVIGLAALVSAVVTSNELVAWVCIGASVLGVVLLIVDALRERQRGDADEDQAGEDGAADGRRGAVDYPEEAPDDQKKPPTRPRSRAVPTSVTATRAARSGQYGPSRFSAPTVSAWRAIRAPRRR